MRGHLFFPLVSIFNIFLLTYFFHFLCILPFAFFIFSILFFLCEGVFFFSFHFFTFHSLSFSVSVQPNTHKPFISQIFVQFLLSPLILLFPSFVFSLSPYSHSSSSFLLIFFVSNLKCFPSFNFPSLSNQTLRSFFSNFCTAPLYLHPSFLRFFLSIFPSPFIPRFSPLPFPFPFPPSLFSSPFSLPLSSFAFLSLPCFPLIIPLILLSIPLARCPIPLLSGRVILPSLLSFLSLQGRTSRARE